MAGLKLEADTDEVAVDAAAILPKLDRERPAKLRVVSKKEDIQV
jgi:hypothetical protein